MACKNGKLHISAGKSMTGHLLGAAGAIEAIATVMTVKTNVIPPTINTKNLIGECSDNINFCLGQKVKKEIKYALSNSFGFGGHCAAVVIKK